MGCGRKHESSSFNGDKDIMTVVVFVKLLNQS